MFQHVSALKAIIRLTKNIRVADVHHYNPKYLFFIFLTVKFYEIKCAVELRYIHPFPHSYSCSWALGYMLQVQTFYFLWNGERKLS